MGRLSAQCTDARVNIVCRELFEKYPTNSDLADAPVEDIENIIRPCGLYKTKAKDTVAMCRMLRDVYGGVIPDTVEELTKLPGVGRKTANLVCGDVYGKPAVVTDTHFIRICGRLGAYPEKEKNPQKIERIMTPLLRPEESADFCHRIVQFGRDTCTARAPKCDVCPLSQLCSHANK